MTEKFDNLFHKKYVGGQGEVEDNSLPIEPINEVSGMSYEEVLAHYRWYVGDPNAQLPEEVEKHFRILAVV